MKTLLLIILSISVLQAGDAKTYTDKRTGLMWQDDDAVGVVVKAWFDMNTVSARRCLFAGDQESCSDTSGDTAATYCQNLKLDGFDDWRLPNMNELSSFDHHARTRARRKLKGSFWSATSDLYKGKPREAAFIKMYGGISDADKSYVMTRDKNNPMFVRCVRGQSALTNMKFPNGF